VNQTYHNPEKLTVEEIEIFEPESERERLSFDLGYEQGWEHAVLDWAITTLRQMVREIDEILAQKAVQR
jgi:hypothetical protein